MKHICILGSGSFGTALAVSLAGSPQDCKITLWCHREETAKRLAQQSENTAHLPGVLLDKSIHITSELPNDVDCFFWVIPVQFSLALLENQLANMPRDIPVVICSKGIELTHQSFLSDIFKNTYGFKQIAVLSGPNFAKEIARSQPTATVLACNDNAMGHDIMHAISTPSFRPYVSDDVIGAEICGAVKNVIAIASGITTGLKLGENARAAILSRGLLEMKRFGMAFGAKADTFMGLAGVGDLTLTCQSETSRNMSLGIRLAKGEKMSEILASRSSVAEGVPTTKAVINLAKDKNISMPICESVYDVLYKDISIEEAIQNLLTRPLRDEFDS